MSLLSDYKGPRWRELLKPTIDALKELDGSGRINELNGRIILNLDLPDIAVDYPHGVNSSSTEVEYQLAWARTALKHLDLVVNTTKGVWVLTQNGHQCDRTNKTLLSEHNLYMKKHKKLKNKAKEEELEEENEVLSEEEVLKEKSEGDWRKSLKKILMTINPYNFEKLAQLVLRESGFMEVEITKKSGDGGFDGKGILRLNNLISMPIIFECKRYTNPIGAEKMRNFRGAMEGRAKRGLYITTSTFSRGAREEATREGAGLIDLIDGEAFIELIKELGLGVSVKQVEKVEIDEDWFKTFQFEK